MPADLSNYVEVNERIMAFHAKYPEGSLQATWQVKQMMLTPGENRPDTQTLIICEARAYRTPDDQRPGVGLASEPFPGLSNFTRNSELMNAETSAWGRALAALGFEVQRGIASREEVEGRRAESGEPQASEKQRDYVAGKGNRKGLIEKAGLEDGPRLFVTIWAQDKMNSDQASQLIEALKADPKAGGALALEMSGYRPEEAGDVPLDQDELEGITS